MAKLTINKITRYKNDKDGNPLKTKDGREYTRVLLETAEYPNAKLSGFESRETMFLKEGSTLEAEVQQNGQHWNFKVLKKDDLLKGRVDSLEARLGMLETYVRGLKPSSEPSPYPTDNSDPDGIPF